MTAVNINSLRGRVILSIAKNLIVDISKRSFTAFRMTTLFSPRWRFRFVNLICRIALQ